MLEEVILRDTRANQPLPTVVPEGSIYFVTDELVLERNNGTAWESISGGIPLISAASRLLGRGSAAGAGAVQEITLGSNLSMSGTVLSASGGILQVTRVLTEAEFEALFTVPIVLISALGAGTIIFPLAWSLKTIVSAGYGSNPIFALRHTGDVGTGIAGTITLNLGDVASRLGIVPLQVQTSFLYSSFDPTNKGLEIYSQNAFVAPGTLTSARVDVAYFVGSGY